MGFASAYLDERVLFPQWIEEAPDKDTGIITVVPAYNEPGTISLLNSLAGCTEPKCRVEVIIVINAPPGASPEEIRINRKTLKDIESWKKANKNCFFRLFAFIVEHPLNGWGVGLARKTGMDEAARRFNSIAKPHGVILCLDADCKVARNYFKAVSEELFINPERSACSIYFEHPLDCDSMPEGIINSIILYEMHLRYYFQGLAYAGFPYVFHTVGSAIAVKAISYIKAGGMNRKQAGEDFYFIQKLVPSGGYFSLNSTTVYPSPRASHRVPFGTGASIGKLSSGKNNTLLTYNFEAFRDLRLLFSMTDDFFACKNEELDLIYTTIPLSFRRYLSEGLWSEKLKEIKDNTSGSDSFKKRFFGWFNMFRIVKYLNFAHTSFLEKKPVEYSASELLRYRGLTVERNDPESLLNLYRELERQKQIS